jgi:hypothetical protein
MDNTDYLETVKAIAEEAIREKGMDYNELNDYIFESVDSSEYIIYSAGHNIIKIVSSNYGTDWPEIHALSGKDAEPEKLHEVAAFEAMIHDCHEKVKEMLKEVEKCENCDKVIFLKDKHVVCPDCKSIFCIECAVKEGEK